LVNPADAPLRPAHITYIGAEPTRCDFCSKIAVGGGNHTDIDLKEAVGPDPLHFTLLQCAL